MERFHLIKNRITQAVFMLDTYGARYRRLAQGFMNKQKLKKYFNKHIILTQRKEAYRPSMLNSFENQLRRRYGELIFFWTIEVQEERAEKSGDRVLHWHCLVGFPWGTPFGREDVLKVQQYWKHGQVEVIPIKKLSSLSYLMKYVTKALNADVEGVYKIRRIGSSRIEGWLRQSWKRLQEAKEFLNILGSDPRDFYWDYRGAYLFNQDMRDVELLKSIGHFKCAVSSKLYVYRHRVSDWFSSWRGDDRALEALTF